MDATAFERARDLFLEGVERFESGRFDAAEACFEASLASLPRRASTLANLGAARVRAGRHVEALAPLDEALALEPHDLDSQAYRGLALAALGRHAEAIACHDAVLAAQPTRVPCWVARAESLRFLERHDEALAAFERVVALAPAHADAWTQIGSIERERGRLGAARAAFERAIAHGGDAALNGWYLAAIAGGTAPPSAPRAYVAGFFDEYAPAFDEHLVGALGYRGPERLLELVAAALPAGRGVARTFAVGLDLGCGTGLCGPLLRPLCERLEGVDLSPRMLERAAARGLYDALACADLVEHLEAGGGPIDLVVAADVFIYVGDLAPVFAAVARRLARDGTFAFTVEAVGADAGDADFVLLPSLRYAHSPRYLHRLADANGLSVATLETAVLRQEQGRAVDAIYVVLRARTGGPEGQAASAG